jgi:hypothetical protein
MMENINKSDLFFLFLKKKKGGWENIPNLPPLPSWYPNILEGFVHVST